MNLNPLSVDEAGELAACLLTSSTIERYTHCLSSAEVVSRLAGELRSARTDGRELLRYAWFYRARVLETSRRSEWELPLAALVFVLGQSGVANVDPLLTALSSARQPQLAWLAGLSRRILASRSGVQFETPPIKLGVLLQEGATILTEGKVLLPPTPGRRTSSSWERHLLAAA